MSTFKIKSLNFSPQNGFKVHYKTQLQKNSKLKKDSFQPMMFTENSWDHITMLIKDTINLQ